MIWRIIASPFVFCLLVIAAIRFVIVNMYYCTRYGHETIALRKGEKKLIGDIFDKLKVKEDETKDKYIQAANKIGQEMLLNRKDYMNSNAIAELVNKKFEKL